MSIIKHSTAPVELVKQNEVPEWISAAEEKSKKVAKSEVEQEAVEEVEGDAHGDKKSR